MATQGSAVTSTESPGPFTRMVRSLSKKDVPQTTSTSTSPVDARSTEAPVTQNDNSAWKVPKQKLAALQRFTKFGKKSDKAEFPPQKWFQESTDPPTEAAKAAAIPLPPAPAEESRILQEDTKGPSTGTGTGETESPPEPTTLAQKIQTLISSLPPFTAPPSSSYPTIPNADGSPSMPPTGNVIADSKLAAFLSSASVMNGSISKGRQSVWAALDRLRSPYHKPTGPVGDESSGGNENRGQQEVDDDDDGNSSVMMYGPLEPSEDSEIEIAMSETMSVYDDDEAAPGSGNTRLERKSSTETLKGTRINRTMENGAAEASDARKPHEKKVKEVTVWIPSATKISLQATWWGYRIFLPPPVLDVLSNKQIEATKRAAILTTSLKWFLDKIPVKMFPAQFRGVAMVLKRLAPYLGYIGAFIAWSWSAIKSFDKGDGVILTATWLLPVAVIPGTWDLNEYPTEPPLPATDADITGSSTNTKDKPTDVKGKGKAT